MAYYLSHLVYTTRFMTINDLTEWLAARGSCVLFEAPCISWRRPSSPGTPFVRRSCSRWCCPRFRWSWRTQEQRPGTRSPRRCIRKLTSDAARRPSLPASASTSRTCMCTCWEGSRRQDSCRSCQSKPLSSSPSSGFITPPISNNYNKDPWAKVHDDDFSHSIQQPNLLFVLLNVS